MRPPAVSFYGPHLEVAATDAQPIALVIHELATNAVTHGSLASQMGTVEVKWRPIDANCFEVLWLERGGNPPPATRRPGFGTVMLDMLIEKQLRGAITKDCQQKGLQVVIRLPGRTGLD